MCNLTMQYPHEEEIAALEIKLKEAKANNSVCTREIKRLKAQLSEAMEKIDRLKTTRDAYWELYEETAKKKDAEIERLRNIAEFTTRRLWFYKSRAAAWKRCAKYWYDFASEYYLRERGLPMDSFVVTNNNNEWVAFKSPPADWREKWIPSSPEDKSTLDKKPDSSES